MLPHYLEMFKMEARNDGIFMKDQLVNIRKRSRRIKWLVRVTITVWIIAGMTAVLVDLFNFLNGGV